MFACTEIILRTNELSFVSKHLDFKFFLSLAIIELLCFPVSPRASLGVNPQTPHFKHPGGLRFLTAVIRQVKTRLHMILRSYNPYDFIRACSFDSVKDGHDCLCVIGY